MNISEKYSIQVGSLADLSNTASTKLKVLIFGEQGTGKTSFAQTAPKPIFLPVEPGLVSIRGKAGNYLRKADGTLFDDPDVLLEILKDKDILTPFDTVIVDPLDMLYKHMLRKALRNVGVSGGEEPGYVNRRHYIYANQDMEQFLKALQQLDKHVICTSLPSERYEEVTGNRGQKEEVMSSIQPAFGASMGEQIGRYFDEVYFLHICKDRSGNRRLVCRPDGLLKIKTRLGLPEYIINPTFDKVVGYLTQPAKAEGKK